MPRASSEPSGDQQRASRPQARVTINEQSNTYRRPEYEHEVESPKKVVNDLLFGAGASSRTAPTSNNTFNTPSYSRPANASTGNYRDEDSTSSFNTTAKLSATHNSSGSSAEYDPETADMSPEELKMLGNRSFENGDFRKAVRYYTKAINKDPTNAALYSNRSAAYLQASKQMGMDTRSMALRDAEKTIELNPKWFKGYSRKGDTLFKMERYDDAIDAYEKGLCYDEGNPSLMHSIGEARNANGGIARRDKRDTPWSIEQKTSVNYKQAYPNQSAHELLDNTRGELNNALGTLVMGDEYRKQQLERFKTQKEVRASGTRPAAPPVGSSNSDQAVNNHGGGGKSLLDMIRSNSPKDVSIPVMANSSAPSGGAGYGRRKDIPESLTSGAASAYQDSLMERYLARKAASGRQ